MQWLVNNSLFKGVCRSIWLCKLTFPVIYRPTSNKSEWHQTSIILIIFQAMTYNLSSKDHHLQNDMTPFFSANLVQVSESQTKCWCKKTMKLSQKQAKSCGKQNCINTITEINQVQLERMEPDLLKAINWKQIM